MSEHMIKQSCSIYFVIVIYNKHCYESETMDYVINHLDEAHYIVVDNSTISNDNSAYCKKFGIEYINMNGNEGLAVAYNQALNQINQSEGYVIWADDDTVFPDDFLIKAVCATSDKNNHVFLPLVKDNKGLFSPCIFDENYLPKRVNECSDFEGARVSGINSGMIVDMAIYNSFRYDENMFLDFIDHDFCYYCNANNINVSLLNNCIIYQNAFFSSDFSFMRYRNRRKVFNHDFRYYCKKHNVKGSVMIRVLLHRDINIIKRFVVTSLERKA